MAVFVNLTAAVQLPSSASDPTTARHRLVSSIRKPTASIPRLIAGGNA
jgi:hypothetical protein